MESKQIDREVHQKYLRYLGTVPHVLDIIADLVVLQNTKTTPKRRCVACDYNALTFLCRESTSIGLPLSLNHTVQQSRELLLSTIVVKDDMVSVSRPLLAFVAARMQGVQHVNTKKI